MDSINGIKFRARNAEVPRCWIYGYYVNEYGTNYIINNDGRFKVVAGTVCRYIGFTDSKNREIYESDITNNGIIRFGRFDDSYVGFYLEDVEWCYKTGKKHHDTHDLFAFTTPFEVLGDIYENEDMLSKQVL